MTPKPADLRLKIKAIRKSVESYQCDDTDKKALARIARSEPALEALADVPNRATSGSGGSDAIVFSWRWYKISLRSAIPDF